MPETASFPPPGNAGPDLVVFGAGYIGGAACREGCRRGLTVWALTRNHERAAELRREGVEVVEADLAGVAWHARIPGEARYVLNCVSSGGGGLAGYARSYEQGAHSILTWAKEAGCHGSLVYTSSTSVYAQGEGARVDEEAATDSAGEASSILLRTEEAMRSWPGPRAIVRLAGIYGPGRHHLLDQLRAGEGTLPGVGTHRLNLIHRDDAVDAIWRIWEAPPAEAPRVYNLADGAPAPKQDVAAWLAARLGRAVPEFSGEAAGGRRRQVPDRTIVADRIRAELGWRPQYPSFREGYAALLGA
jgi:nucleoside-diphosphate-sugar epimerase